MNSSQRDSNNRGRRPYNSGRNSQSSGHSSGGGQPQGGGYSNNRRRRRKPLSSSQIIIKYDTLLQQHMLNRKKLFELFHRADPQQKLKLQRKCVESLEAIKQYQDSLRPWQLEVLNKRIEGYKPDLTFSSNNNIDPNLSEDPGEGPFEEIHLNSVQRSRPSYKDDHEESIGTIEDYYSYKGLSPEELHRLEVQDASDSDKKHNPIN